MEPTDLTKRTGSNRERVTATAPLLPERVVRTIAEVKQLLRARFGHRLDSITLFGSWAWGRPHGESDIDVCIVIDGLTHQEHVEVVELIVDRGILCGVDLSPLVWSRERLLLGLATEQRLMRDVVERGIAL